MSSFWMLSGLLILLALCFVLWPLIARPVDPFVGRAAALRQQLHTLDLAERDGLLSAADAGVRRDRLKSELLALVDQPSAAAGKRAMPLPTVLVLAIGVPLITVILYRQFGTPHALLFAAMAAPRTESSAASSSAPDAAASAAQAPDLRGAADALAQRLADRPDDVEGWTLLARTWQELGEFTQARDAFAKVYALKPDDPEVLCDYAQALGLASNPRSLLGQPRELLEKALEINPRHQRAMWLYGYALRQAGDLPATLELWDRLLAQMPEGSAEVVSLTEQINVVRKELGRPLLPVPAVIGSSPTTPPVAANRSSATPAAEPSTAPVTAAAGAGLRVLVELDPKLAARVTASDVLYVFAKAQSGPPMPLAIQRVTAGQLPFAVRLDDSMAMTPALTLSTFPQVIVGARISKSGNAQASSGDLQGFSAAVSQPSTDEIRVLISDVVP